MLSWSKTSKRIHDQLVEMASEIEVLRNALAHQAQRADALEQKLRDQSARLDHFEQLEQRVDQAHAQANDCMDAIKVECDERERDRQRLERLEQHSDAREADGHKLAATLTKLEKRIEQQTKDAATAAALFEQRLEQGR